MNRVTISFILGLLGCENTVDFPEMGPESLIENPADLTDPEVVLGLATAASAPMIGYYLPEFLQQWVREAPGCPRLVDERDADGNGLQTFVGDCVDSRGNAWTGRAEVDTDGARVALRFDDLASEAAMTCPDGRTGIRSTLVTGHHLGRAEGRYDVDLSIVENDQPCQEGPQRTDILYVGRTVVVELEDGGGSIGEHSGSGTFASSVYGWAAVSTEDERIDLAVCNHEALSGATTLQSDGDVAVITYDGDVDCDPERTVTWTLDEVPQGELEGVACSATGSSAGGVVLICLGLLGLARRRR